MATSQETRTIEEKYLQTAVGYADYIRQVEELLADGKVTGGQHPEIYLHFTRMNLQRMHRLEKTMVLLPQAQQRIGPITVPQTWLVLTEGWCGDAAQSMPVMQAFASLNPVIVLKVLLRDENPELMDRYLTNGVARSIPKLIAVRTDTREEMFTWGPRPAPLQESFYRMRTEGLPHDDIKEKLQRWYNMDKTATIQEEISLLANPDLPATTPV